MKNLKFLLVISLSAVLFSCNSDDDSTANNDEIYAGLIGTWNLTALDFTSSTTIITANGTTVYSNSVGVGRDLDFTVTYTENPNELLSQGSYITDLTTTEDGEISHQSIGTAGSFTSNWSLNDNQITITNGTTMVFTINLLDENSLVYFYNDTLEFDIGGEMHTSIINEIYTFSRQ